MLSLVLHQVCNASWLIAGLLSPLKEALQGQVHGIWLSAAATYMLHPCGQPVGQPSRRLSLRLPHMTVIRCSSVYAR
jgi:hypothetical protein